MATDAEAPEFQVCVVGGGVVGAAVCRDLARRGLSVVLVERDVIGGGVSAGNTGIACTLLDVKEGTLERRCLERGLALNLGTYEALSIPHRACGALYVAWTEEELAALQHLARRADGARLLGAGELYRDEPNLGPGARGALLVPGEVVVDPGLVPLAYAADALACGAVLFEGAEVSSAQREGRLWRLQLRRATGSRAAAGAVPASILARHVVNCGGLGADTVEAAGRRPSALAFRPRRGDFLLFGRPRDRPAPLLRPIGAVPTALARGVYVWATVHGDVVCGPTNVEQVDKATGEVRHETLAALRAKAVQVCPALKDWHVVGHYSGLRPALDPASFGTDYRLETSREDNWTLVAGIRSTGLTASLGLAAIVGDEVTAAFAGRPGTGSSPSLAKPPAPLPPVPEIIRDYAQRADGTVLLQGRPFRINHPISLLGLSNGRACATAEGDADPASSSGWGSRVWFGSRARL